MQSLLAYKSAASAQFCVKCLNWESWRLVEAAMLSQILAGFVLAMPAPKSKNPEPAAGHLWAAKYHEQVCFQEIVRWIADGIPDAVRSAPADPAPTLDASSLGRSDSRYD